MGYDVAVVGAGPAGAWTATLLARRGARVLLLDPSHPREKPCGGGLTGRALALVGDAIGPGGVPHVGITRARFLDSGAAVSASVPLPMAASALVVASRTDFDSRLWAAAAAAGADTRAARVTAIARSDTGFSLDTSSGHRFDTKFLVGADGANSLVRRRLASPFRRDQLSLATGYFARGVTSEEVVIEMVADPPGYIWSFPRPDHLAIGICAQGDEGIGVHSLRTVVRDWIARTHIADNAQLDVYSWPIPSLGAKDFQSLTVAGPGWLTVGDAAGLVDPITREGIFFALQSAIFAAEALTSHSPDVGKRYSDRVRDEIGAELIRAARFKAGLFRPRFTRLLIQALASSGGVRAVMADLIAGTQGYRDLKWRLAKTLELGLVWQLMMSG
jgi:geranylgeranyl reductase family protein